MPDREEQTHAVLVEVYHHEICPTMAANIATYNWTRSKIRKKSKNKFFIFDVNICVQKGERK